MHFTFVLHNQIEELLSEFVSHSNAQTFEY